MRWSVRRLPNSLKMAKATAGYGLTPRRPFPAPYASVWSNYSSLSQCPRVVGFSDGARIRKKNSEADHNTSDRDHEQ